MNAHAQNPRAVIGDNRAPFEIHEEKIMGLFDEARNFLDGDPIETQEMADAVGKILDLTRKAKKAADEQRAAEKKPHMDAAKAVDDLWKPIIGRADLATDAAKKALAPFLEAQEKAKREKAERLRKEAEEKAHAAQEALRASQGDLTARADAEDMLTAAKAAEKAAGKAEKSGARAAGGGRAVTLRTVYESEVTDYHALALHIWRTDADALKPFLAEYAAKKTRQSPDAARALPGVTVHENKVPV
jgi:hypothetical protein